MKSFAKFVMGSLAAMMVIIGAARADDSSSLRAELADLKSKIASLESSQSSSSVPGEAQCLTSMRKKGSIKIGGEAKLDLLWVHREDSGLERNVQQMNNNTSRAMRSRSTDDTIDSTRFGSNSTNLWFDVNASADTKLHMKLDLDDFADGGNADVDDLLEEVYFEWKNVRGVPLTLYFGKKEVAYGLDKTIGITETFHHGSGADWLDDDEGAGGGDNGNPHDQIGSMAMPGERDNRFQVAAKYKLKDMLTFTGTVFQDDRGMYEDRSEDNMLFQSWALKVEWDTPVEGWYMSTSVMNRHQESTTDDGIDTYWVAGKEGTDTDDNIGDMTQFSVASTYKLPFAPVKLFGEWQYCMNANHNDDTTSSVYQIGAEYKLNKHVKFGMMGEWAHINEGVWNTTGYGRMRMEDEDYSQLVMNCTYTFDSGMYIILEYAHQWYDGRSDQIDHDIAANEYLQFGDSFDRDGSMIGVRCGWKF